MRPSVLAVVVTIGPDEKYRIVVELITVTSAVVLRSPISQRTSPEVEPEAVSAQVKVLTPVTVIV
jgi:hypothetical protein